MATINGTAGADNLVGTSASDSIYGKAGNDTINGAGGNDFVYGEAGDDVITVTNSSNVEGGIGNDRITGSSLGEQNIRGGDGADTIYGEGGRDFLYGDAGADVIYTGADGGQGTQVRGGDGNDTIYSGGGVISQLGGDAGDDTFFVVQNIGTSSERYSGGADFDQILATANNQTIGIASLDSMERISGNGFSNVSIQTGNEAFSSLNLIGVQLVGITQINGQSGDNAIVLEGGYLNGNAALARADVVNGGDGNDVILSGFGNDTIRGDAGNDTLAGGQGADTIVGGTGADRFAVEYLADSSVGNADTITDFSTGQGDKIDVSNIDANANTADNQAFTFIGTAAFSGTAGQLRYSVDATGSAQVYGDTNGDGSADFQITVLNTPALATTDFVL